MATALTIDPVRNIAKPAKPVAPIIPDGQQPITPSATPGNTPETRQAATTERHDQATQTNYRAVVQELHEAINGGVWGLFPDEERAMATIKSLSKEGLAEVKRIYNDRFKKLDTDTMVETSTRYFDTDLKNALSTDNYSLAQQHINGQVSPVPPALPPAKNVSIAERAATIHEELHSWGWGAREPERIYEAVTGLSPTEKKALEDTYKSKYSVALNDDLNASLKNRKLSATTHGHIVEILKMESDNKDDGNVSGHIPSGKNVSAKTITGLTKAQALHYAMHEKAEPDQAAVVSIIRSVRPGEEKDEFVKEYNAYNGPVALKSDGKKDLMADIDERMSGREKFYADDHLKALEEVQNNNDARWLHARKMLERAEEHYRSERSVDVTNGIVAAIPGAAKDEHLQNQIERMRAEYNKAVTDKNISEEEWKRLNELASYVRNDTASYAVAKDSVIQTTASVADTAVTAAVITATSGLALPLVSAKVTLAARAGVAISAGANSYQSTKQGLQGEAYNRYDEQGDLVDGTIDSAATVVGIGVAGGVAKQGAAKTVSRVAAGGATAGGLSGGLRAAHAGGDAEEIAGAAVVGATAGAVGGFGGSIVGGATNSAVRGSVHLLQNTASYLGGRYQAVKGAVGQALAGGVTKIQQGMTRLRGGTAGAGQGAPPAAGTVTGGTAPATGSSTGSPTGAVSATNQPSSGSNVAGTTNAPPQAGQSTSQIPAPIAKASPATAAQTTTTQTTTTQTTTAKAMSFEEQFAKRTIPTYYAGRLTGRDGLNELVKRHNLRFDNEVTIADNGINTTYRLTQPFADQSTGNVYALAVVEKGTLAPTLRVLIQNKSTGDFQLLPKVIVDSRNNALWDKTLKDRFMGEPGSYLPYQVQKSLNETIAIQGVRINLGPDAEELAVRFIPSESRTTGKGTRVQGNNGAQDDLNQSQQLDGLTIQTIGGLPRTSTVSPPPTGLRNPTQAPDFTKRIDSYPFPHPHAGDTTCHVYPSRDGKFIYRVYETGDGKIFYGITEDGTAPILDNGIRSSQVNTKFSQPLWRPKAEIKDTNLHRFTHKSDPELVNTWNHLRTNPLIELWYTSQGKKLPDALK